MGVTKALLILRGFAGLYDLDLYVLGDDALIS